MGDFNYRVDLELQDAQEMLENNDIETLLDSDQFIKEQNVGLDMDNFYEGKIEFMPTYKYKIDSDNYDFSDRVPSWTDRIIYKSKITYDLIQLEYKTINDIRISDHKPVYSVFKILLSEICTDRDNQDNSILPFVFSDYSNMNCNGSPVNYKSSLCVIF